MVRLDKEALGFKEELFRISWYMRGGVTVNDLMHIYSHEDREMIYKIIADNIELSKVTQQPFI